MTAIGGHGFAIKFMTLPLDPFYLVALLTLSCQGCDAVISFLLLLSF